MTAPPAAAAPREVPSVSRGSVDRDLAVRTVASLRFLMTSSGHLCQRVTNESRGNCLPPGHCTPECRLVRATFAEWTEIWEALDGERPTHLALEDAS